MQYFISESGLKKQKKRGKVPFVKKARKSAKGGALFRNIRVGAVIFALACLIFVLLFDVSRQSDISMEPNIGENDLVLLWNPPWEIALSCGDIVSFDTGRSFGMRRIVCGKGEESVLDFDGLTDLSRRSRVSDSLRISQEEHLEIETTGEKSYLIRPAVLKRRQEERIALREREYILLSDNREFSLDSRVFGAVPKEKIGGVVLFGLYASDARTALFGHLLKLID